jgi:hypothetical protein
MTALPPSDDFTNAATTEGGFKTAITGMRDFLSGLFGADGTKPTARYTLAVSQADAVTGLGTSNGTDTDHDIDIVAGECLDSTRAVVLIGTAQTKQIDATWATGTNAGGLASALTLSADTWYHLFITDDGAGGTEYGWDTSVTAANLLSDTGGTLYRLIFSHLTDPSLNIVPYTQDYDEVTWDVAVRDIADTNPGTAPVLPTLTVPVGIKSLARINGQLVDSSPSSTIALLITATSSAATAPTTSTSGVIITSGVPRTSFSRSIISDTSGQIRYEINISDTGVTVSAFTSGYKMLGR